MPSRAAAVAKVLVCATTNTSSAPQRSVVPQPRGSHLTTQTQLSLKRPRHKTANRHLSVSASSLFDELSLFSCRRHHRHHHHNHLSTQMDAALAKIFLSNAQWVKAVNASEPGFFEQSAQGQTPKVWPLCLRPAAITSQHHRTLLLSFVVHFAHVRSCACRSSGSDAPTLASPRASSRPLDPATSSFTATSPSKHVSLRYETIFPKY